VLATPETRVWLLRHGIIVSMCNIAVRDVATIPNLLRKGERQPASVGNG